MAIPKEPRQIMINIMYLVLTAMLALNVSAEIFNAFDIVNRGLKASNQAIDKNINGIVNAIKQNAEKDPESYQKFVDKIPQVKNVTADLTNYIDNLTNYMITESGGRDEEGHLVGKKDKDITTRYLVDKGKGEKLKELIMSTRQDFIAMVPDSFQAEVMQNIPLQVDNKSWKEANKPSWSNFNFKQMPLKAVLPILTKYKNDAMSSEAVVLNKYLEIIGGEDIVFNQYKVVSSPKKSYIITGETFTTEVFMSATSKNVEGLSIFVNGREMKLENGVATYSTTPSSTGIKKYTAKVRVKNPVTGEVTENKETFEYEVGERSVSVSADKMNVMYIGVDNPLTISAAGVSSNKLNVSGSGSGLRLTPNGGASYTARVSSQGKAKVRVSGGGLPTTTKVFRVKRIPDPVPMIGGQQGGAFGSGQFKVQTGIYGKLKDFDFDAQCDIVSFDLVYIPRGSDAITASNSGGSYDSNAQNLVNKASPGDRYSFEDIKTKCPGDRVSRTLPGFVVNIQ